VQDQEMITNKRAHVSHRYLRWLFSSCYPLVNIQKTSENHHFWWENPLFSIPEGNWNAHPSILYVPTGGTHFKNQLPSPTASWKNFPSANWHNKHETYGQTVLLVMSPQYVCHILQYVIISCRNKTPPNAPPPVLLTWTQRRYSINLQGGPVRFKLPYKAYKSIVVSTIAAT
jgi:hypothetical protein